MNNARLKIKCSRKTTALDLHRIFQAYKISRIDLPEENNHKKRKRLAFVHLTSSTDCEAFLASNSITALHGEPLEIERYVCKNKN